MPGTQKGNHKVRDKLLKKDPDYYKKIGAIGGKKSRNGGFHVNRELAIEAGRKGGQASSRKGIPNKHG